MTEQTTYYTSMMPKMMRGFETMFRSAKKPLSSRMTPEQVDDVHQESREKYEGMIPQLPYIGGKKVSATGNVVGAAQVLSIALILEKKGMAEREIGQVMYDTMVACYDRIPKRLGSLIGKMMLSKRSLNKMRKSAMESQKRKYPEGFVSEVVSCEGTGFDYGYDYHECGVHKFYKAQGALKYLPYMCLSDYPMFKRLGIGFYRDKTIANGSGICTFRIKRKGQTPVAWPPENLKEWR